LDVLASSVERFQLLRVELLLVPDSIDTNKDITPDTLERMASFRVTIERPGLLLGHLRKGLASTIGSVVPRRHANENGVGEVRAAIIFYGPENKRMDAIFFDTHTRRAVFMDGTIATLDGDLLRWVTSCFGSQLR
jgi:hypothetical protein